MGVQLAVGGLQFSLQCYHLKAYLKRKLVCSLCDLDVPTAN